MFYDELILDRQIVQMINEFLLKFKLVWRVGNVTHISTSEAGSTVAFETVIMSTCSWQILECTDWDIVVRRLVDERSENGGQRQKTCCKKQER